MTRENVKNLLWALFLAGLILLAHLLEEPY